MANCEEYIQAQARQLTRERPYFTELTAAALASLRALPDDDIRRICLEAITTAAQREGAEDDREDEGGTSNEGLRTRPEDEEVGRLLQANAVRNLDSAQEARAPLQVQREPSEQDASVAERPPAPTPSSWSGSRSLRCGDYQRKEDEGAKQGTALSLGHSKRERLERLYQAEQSGGFPQGFADGGAVEPS